MTAHPRKKKKERGKSWGKGKYDWNDMQKMVLFQFLGASKIAEGGVLTARVNWQSNSPL